MKTIIKYLNLACCVGLSAAVTALAEPTPSPSPSSTPHTEPSATPSATPRHEPAPPPTPPPRPPEPTPTPTATPGGDHGEVSLRGVYGTTTPGSLVVFYIEKNAHVQIHLFDATGQGIGFAEGALNNGYFSLVLTTGQGVVGKATENGITFVLGGQTFQASRFSTFG